MKYLFAIVFLILVSACGKIKKDPMSNRTVKSLKTGRIYEYRIHELQKKNDIILIQDPWEQIVKKGQAKYDSVIILN